MIKNKKLLICLTMLLVSITLLLLVSIRTNSLSTKINDLQQQVGIKE